MNSTKTLIISLITVDWHETKDDDVVIATATSLMQRIEAAAKRRGVFHPFKYANYCDGAQDPFAGYAEGKLDMMRAVSRKYDPQRFFQRSVPGGFKVGI